MDLGGYQIIDFTGVEFTGTYSADAECNLDAEGTRIAKVAKRMKESLKLDVPLMFRGFTMTLAGDAKGFVKNATLYGYRYVAKDERNHFILILNAGVVDLTTDGETITGMIKTVANI